MARWPMFVLVIGLVPASSPDAAPTRAPSPNDVQVIAQWSLPMAKPATGYPFDLLSAFDASGGCIPADQTIARRAGGVYFDDGNDVGGGNCNIYLYTDRPTETVARLAAMENDGLLPRGMRVGVANDKNSAHTDWTYLPAYPANLKRFDQ